MGTSTCPLYLYIGGTWKASLISQSFSIQSDRHCLIWRELGTHYQNLWKKTHVENVGLRFELYLIGSKNLSTWNCDLFKCMEMTSLMLMCILMPLQYSIILPLRQQLRKMRRNHRRLSSAANNAVHGVTSSIFIFEYRTYLKLLKRRIEHNEMITKCKTL